MEESTAESIGIASRMFSARRADRAPTRPVGVPGEVVHRETRIVRTPTGNARSSAKKSGEWFAGAPAPDPVPVERREGQRLRFD